MVISVGVGVVAGPAAAQELGVRGGVSPLGEQGRLAIVSENDLFYFGVGEGTDRLYTNGIYLHSEWISPWVESLTDRLGVGWLFPARDRAYIGVGLTHELHTPETLNPCGSYYGDPLVTSEDPGARSRRECLLIEARWQDYYAERDRPFAAVGSVFFTAQRYLAAAATRGPFTQARLWARVDFGAWGSAAVAGYEVQKNWHGFFNDALLAADSAPAEQPIGWKLAEQRSRALVQGALGTDVSLFRSTTSVWSRPLGFEVEGRASVRAGTPRNTLSAGPAVRLGLLPDHASTPLRTTDELQSVEIYLEGWTGATAVVTDATYGAFDRYRHFRDEHGAAVVLKVLGTAVSAQLHAQRILFEHPLKQYPSLQPLDAKYHRYGRVALELTY